MLPLTQGKKVSREEAVQTLVAEGGIKFPVEKIEDITDEMIISAAVQVIDDLAETREKLFKQLEAEFDLTKQFYRACQRANIVVSRDKDNKIQLEKVNL